MASKGSFEAPLKSFTNATEIATFSRPEKEVSMSAQIRIFINPMSLLVTFLLNTFDDVMIHDAFTKLETSDSSPGDTQRLSRFRMTAFENIRESSRKVLKAKYSYGER